MVRFIFVCMAIVALSAVSIAGQFLYDDMTQSRQDVIARNTAAVAKPAAEDTATPEGLNEISTAAGAFDPNDNFTGGFTGEAPKALRDDTAMAVPAAAAQDQ